MLISEYSRSSPPPPTHTPRFEQQKNGNTIPSSKSADSEVKVGTSLPGMLQVQEGNVAEV